MGYKGIAKVIANGSNICSIVGSVEIGDFSTSRSAINFDVLPCSTVDSLMFLVFLNKELTFEEFLESQERSVNGRACGRARDVLINSCVTASWVFKTQIFVRAD